jgi:prepilin-type N-terminal cleavage/methylation domain-containing protein
LATADSRIRRVLGFTLVEMAVAVAVLAILTAILLATVVVNRGRSRVSESHEVLTELVRTLHFYDTALAFGDVPPTEGRFPFLLSHLTNEISITSSPPCQVCQNSCGALYVGKNVDGWRQSGPFYRRDIPFSVGLRIPIGLIRDSLTRIPATAADVSRSFGRLQIRIDSVALLDAQDLDERVDGVASQTAGVVTWTAAPDADGMLSSIFWNMPVGGC